MKVRHVDFYPDEWLAGTARMSPLDVGVYVTACSLIYSHGGEVEESELKRFLTCHGNALKASVERLVASGKLTRRGSCLWSIRCGNELEKAQKRIRNALDNGQKGGRPVSTIQENQDVTEMGGISCPITTNHQPDIKEDSPPPPTPLIAAPGGVIDSEDQRGKTKVRKGKRIDRGADDPEFYECYLAFPRHEAPHTAQTAYWKARILAAKEDLLAGALRYRASREGQDPQFTALMATWLNGGRWKDEACQAVGSNEPWRDPGPDESPPLGLNTPPSTKEYLH